MTTPNLDAVSVIIDSITDRNDLLAINEMIKNRFDTLARRAVRNFKPGDKVAWDGKRGHKTGVVQRVNPKNIVVKTDMGLWNVTASMLSHA